MTTTIDRFTTLPAVTAAALIALFIGERYAITNFDYGNGIALLLTALASIAVFVLDLVLLGNYAVGRCWRRLVSVTIALVLFICCFYSLPAISFGLDRIRFELFRDYYVRALTPPPDSAGSWHLRALHWAPLLSGTFYRQLVYDETDSIMIPDDPGSAKLRAEIYETFHGISPSSCQLSARRVEGHFYIVDVDC
jgi:hypothetical protein